MNRYSRHIILSEVGPQGQDKLNNAKVLVIGAGGLGCPVLQYLAAAGIGTLGIIDHDMVDITNLQRQVLFGSSSLGINKALAAKQRLEDLNNSISIIAYAEQLTYKNALTLFENYDIVVDGSDNFETRYLVNDACILTNTPLVFGAIYKFEGQVSVFNYQNGPSYRCLFPNPPQKDSVPNCSEIGVMGVLPGIIGSMQANEALKIILGIGNILSGKLFCYNALTLENSTIKIKRDQVQIDKVLKAKGNFSKRKLQEECTFIPKDVSIRDALRNTNAQFIDVRESHEQPKVEGIDITYIPLSELEQHLHKIDKEKDKFIFCQSGIRSKTAVAKLNALHIGNCYNINDTITEIIKHTQKLHNIH